MTKAEQVFELWRTFGWNVEPLPEMRGPELGPETWCHGFIGHVADVDPDDWAKDLSQRIGTRRDPEPEPEIKVERGTDR